MDEWIPCLLFLAAAVPFVALILAIVAVNRIQRLRFQLERLERRLDEMGARLRVGGAHWPAPPSVPQRPREPVERAEPAGVSGGETAPAIARPPEEAAEARPEPGPSVPDQAGEIPVAPPVVETAGPPAPAWPTATVGPAEKTSLEEKLGSRLFVWIAAVAMALAGAFLVKYTFDRDLLTERVRVILGLVFGAAFLAIGEWMRSRSARIAEGLSAAGITVLFTSLFAAVNLYDLISPMAGFVLMALVTALAVVLSLRQGPFVALLGLVGGFVTPILVKTPEPHPSLFAYLLMLEVGLLAVTRRRGWALLAALTLAGGMIWAGGWMVGLYEPGHDIWLGPFLLVSVMAFAASAQLGRAEEAWGGPAITAALTWAATVSGLLLVSLLVGIGEFSTLEWAFFGLLGVGCLVLGRLDSKLEGLAWLASAAGIALLLAWHLQGSAPAEGRFGLTVLVFGALYAAGAYACLWGSRRPVYWAGLSVVSTIGYLLVGYFCLESPPPHLAWGTVCLILGLLYVLAAAPVARRRTKSPGWEMALAALAVGVTALVSLAAPIELERAWISVAWALEIPALALIDWLLRIPALRILARVLAGGVIVRLMFNPWVLGYPIGTHPVWNWILYGYGLPVLALAAGAWLFRPSKDERLVEALGGGAIVLGFALITLEIRQYFHPGAPGSSDFGLDEWATFSAGWLVYALGLLAAAGRWPRRCITWGGELVAGVALIEVALVTCMIENPLWSHHPVGIRPIVNHLLHIYGLPAGLALAVAWALIRQGERQPASVIGAASLAILFLLVTLEVRQFFQGNFLDGGLSADVTTNAEWYTYSAAWILFGALLLILGITTGGLVLRYASLVVMLLAAGKVFLSDTRELGDLYRVFSLFGLGVSLFALAYLYQRFVFSRTD